MTTPIQLGRVQDLAQFSNPARVNLQHTRGDSFQLALRLYEEVDACGDAHGAQTLTGLTGRAVLRMAVDHPSSWNFAVSVDTSAGSGRVTVSATALETRLMPETGVWELELTDGASTRKTIVRGCWKMTRDIAT